MVVCDDDSSDLALNRQLCFALYAASRAMTRAYQPMLKALGITYPQYLVLMVLWEWASAEAQQEEEPSVSALGQRLMLDSGTLTPLLKRMEQNGLVLRRRSKRDERITLVEVTYEGLTLKPKAREWVSSQLESSSINRNDVERLHRDLWQFLHKLTDI
ncbi:MarR family winged helix-turn-helix transcriptional regulator [Microbulbifer okhotskensis]|uniref:MarR family winged helix-turn-helix transcriptional regulator n=1 Tax=Microbulbifer okhotskensis TaxID=2926617 RepID=UPI00273A5F3C|nr:MarR family transcriptional regulator [Microbulbifer okhotskensis]